MMSTISSHHGFKVFINEDAQWSSSIDSSFNDTKGSLFSTPLPFFSTSLKSCLGLYPTGRPFPYWSIATSFQRPALYLKH